MRGPPQRRNAANASNGGLRQRPFHEGAAMWRRSCAVSGPPKLLLYRAADFCIIPAFLAYG
jgi:hypothetical protein